MIDQTDGNFGLRADAPDGQAVVTELLQALDRGFDQRQAPLIGQLAFETRGCVFFPGALQSGRSIETPPLEVAENLARGIVTGGARYTAARVSAGAAHVQARQRA